MEILRAAEDYLEAMLMLQQEKGFIRSIDVADKLGVTKPSVTYATKRLRESGYIIMNRDGHITLTEGGLHVAQEMLSRHTVLTGFLTSLGVEPAVAEADACKMEHDISPQTFTAICKYVGAHRESWREQA